MAQLSTRDRKGGAQLLVEKKPPAPRTPIHVKIMRVDKVSPAMAGRIGNL